MIDTSPLYKYVISGADEAAYVKEIGAREVTGKPIRFLGIGESLVGRLLLFDALETEFTELKLRRDPNCPVCGDSPTITQYIDYVEFCAR